MLPCCILSSVDTIWSTAIFNTKCQWLEKKQQLETKALQVAADKYSIVTCWHEPSPSTILNAGQKAQRIQKSILNYNLHASDSLPLPPKRISFSFPDYMGNDRILFTFYPQTHVSVLIVSQKCIVISGTLQLKAEVAISLKRNHLFFFSIICMRRIFFKYTFL